MHLGGSRFGGEVGPWLPVRGVLFSAIHTGQSPIFGKIGTSEAQRGHQKADLWSLL
jgi:hypothetical protein